MNSIELKAFGMFIRSPYVNKRSDLIHLLEAIRSNIRAQSPLLRDKIWQQINPNELFDRVKFDLLLSYLFQLVRSFYLIHPLANNSNEHYLKLMNTFQKKGLNIDFEQTARQLKNQLNQSEFIDSSYHLESFDYNYLLQKEQSKRPQKQSTFLKNMHQHLDAYYFGQKLKLLWIAASKKAIYQSEVDLVQAEYLLQEVINRNLLEVPFVAIYYYAYQLVQSPEDDNIFKHYKNYLIEHGSRFDSDEIQALYLAAINHCVRKGNEGISLFFNEAFSLYQAGLENELLLNNGKLSRFTYHNIVAAGLYCDAFEWTQNFIHEYKKKLEKKYQDSAFSYSKAKLAYSQKDYDIALELLQKANYRDVLLNLAAKSLLLKIYYEKREFDPLDAHLSAFQSYLRRKKVLGYHKINYQNIIRYAKKMIHYNPYDASERRDLLGQIEAEAILTEKKWMVTQLTDY